MIHQLHTDINYSPRDIQMEHIVKCLRRIAVNHQEIPIYHPKMRAADVQEIEKYRRLLATRRRRRETPMVSRVG